MEKQLLKARVMKGYFSFYYCEAEGKLYECRLRGRFKKENISVLVGDLVLIQVLDETHLKGVVEEVLPRKNRLIRPLVSNVNQAFIVEAFDHPEPDLWLLDRLLIMTIYAGIRPVILWNKSDLVKEEEKEIYLSQYRDCGITQISICTKTGENLDQVKECLKDRATVLCGPSGVGKSSLLNAIEPGLELQTGEISEKMERGKHTTRHAEWMKLSFGGFIADTPGFSNLFLPEELKKEELAGCYPDFLPYLDQCRYPGCSHIKERDCGILNALKEGKIHEKRYERYVALYQALQEKEEKKYK